MKSKAIQCKHSISDTNQVAMGSGRHGGIHVGARPAADRREQSESPRATRGVGRALAHLVAAVELGVGLLHQRNPHLINSGRPCVQQPAIRVARQPIVDRDRPPLTLVMEDERALAAGGRLFPPAKDARQQLRLQRNHAEGREEPAIAQRALHYVGGGRRIHKKCRSRRADRLADLRRAQPPHVLCGRMAGGRTVVKQGSCAVKLIVGVCNFAGQCAAQLELF
eukprot:scaffold5240_cov116-Isochrysis_galbana.AAC.2